MGAYIYGYTKKEKILPTVGTVGAIKVGVVKYLYKPSDSFYGTSAQEKRLETRYWNMNEGRTLPRYVVVNGIKVGAEVHDMKGRKGLTGDSISLRPTFYDDPYGFGPVVGKIVKSGRMYVCEINDGSSFN